MSGSDGASYRLATVERADIAQTVDADGTLAARDSSALSFAVAGTVASVQVAVGDKVRAGDSLATLDRSALEADVTSARASLADARQRLADDEDAQATGTSSSTGSTPSAATPTASSARTPESASSVRLVSATASRAPTTPTSSAAVDAVRKAQQAVEAAQRALDDAVAAVTSDVDELAASCTGADVDTTTTTVTAGDDGIVSGTNGSTAMVATLLDTATTSANPQSIAAGGTYTFGGLTAGESYRVVLVPRIDTVACAAAIDTIQNDQSSTSNDASVVSAKATLEKAIVALDSAVAALSSSSGPTGTTHPGASSSSGPAAPSGTGSRSSNSNPAANADGSSSPMTAVTAEQIAADTKAIDAAEAQLAVAKHAVGYATLTTPISGTVGAVGIGKGESVSAASTTSAITVVGSGTLSVDLSIGIADIDLVKVGQSAQVTIDGRSKPVAAKVAYVGVTNSSDSTGSSSTYPVTVSLDASDARLFDGMGASVAIEVGEADHVLSVPISAVHTVGTLHTVTTYANGKTSTTRVTVGVVGNERVEVTSGLSVGDRVVLAEVSASVPSSDTSRFGGNRSSLGGLTPVTGGGGGPVFNGPPGGR